eukprot:406667_1
MSDSSPSRCTQTCSLWVLAFINLLVVIAFAIVCFGSFGRAISQYMKFGGDMRIPITDEQTIERMKVLAMGVGDEMQEAENSHRFTVMAIGSSICLSLIVMTGFYFLMKTRQSRSRRIQRELAAVEKPADSLTQTIELKDENGNVDLIVKQSNQYELKALYQPSVKSRDYRKFLRNLTPNETSD